MSLMQPSYRASVDVNSDYVNHRGNNHHENERDVQRVPEREQSLVAFKPRDATRSRQPAVDVGACHDAQALALRRTALDLRASARSERRI